MTGIDHLRSASPIGMFAERAGAPTAYDVARIAVAEIGHRVLSWTGLSMPEQKGAAAWAEQMGPASAFSPDPSLLAGRGDIYGLRDLALDIARQFGATTVEQGTLLGALEDLTREVVIRFAGLAGLPGEGQVTGLADALDQAAAGGVTDSIDGITQLLSEAALDLGAQRL